MEATMRGREKSMRTKGIGNHLLVLGDIPVSQYIAVQLFQGF